MKVKLDLSWVGFLVFLCEFTPKKFQWFFLACTPVSEPCYIVTCVACAGKQWPVSNMCDLSRMVDL